MPHRSDNTNKLINSRSLRDLVFTGLIALLASAALLLLYDRHNILTNRTSHRNISIQWLPTGQYFQNLGEPWPHAGPSIRDLQTLHVRHLPQRPAICILMVDSRPCDLESYGATHAYPPDLAAVSPSLALHYALMHGYDFVRGRIPADPTERTAAWYSVPMLSHLLKEYNYVFKMDGDSFFNQLSRRIEPVIRQHRLDEDKALWVPRDIRFQGYEYPDSNINAGVFLIARKAYTTALLQDWWNCPTDGTGDPSWTQDWPAEQGCLWRAVVNSSRWSAACVPDWGTEFVGERPAWVHHLASGKFSDEARSSQGAQAAVQYFLHSVRQALVPRQARLGYSEHVVLLAGL